MKFIAKLSICMASLFVSIHAFGGAGLGGSGFGKTKLLLQNFVHAEAILTLDGITNVPESDTTPKLVIPEDEYQNFVSEVEKEVATGSKSFVLAVELEDGSVRNFILRYLGEVGKEPLFLYLIEEKSGQEH